jgi:U3 small nucleolar RNA-associated protein 14
MKHVIINEKRPKKSLQYMVPSIPHGFENRDQYERVIRMPIGKEWNAQGVFRERIKPKVQTKLGTVIDPLKFVALAKSKKKPARSSKKL